MAVQDRVHTGLQALGRGLGAEAEVEVQHQLARDHVGGAGAGVHVADLPAGGREEGIAVVPVRGHQFGQRRRQLVDRVARQLRVGDVALDAAHRELARQRAAAAVLDHVAELLDRGRLADDAGVQPLAACLQPLHQAHRAVHRRAFFVAGDQQRDGARVFGVRGDETFGGHREGGDRTLHVGGAAAVELAVAHAGHKRVAGPALQRAGGHHVGVAGKGQRRAGPAAAADGPEVLHAEGLGSVDHLFAVEATGLQPGRQQVLAAGVVGRHGTAGDQRLQQAQGVAHGPPQRRATMGGSEGSGRADALFRPHLHRDLGVDRLVGIDLLADRDPRGRALRRFPAARPGWWANRRWPGLRRARPCLR